ncbi:uncharacterized protein RAG0_04832 [Rhynchosporium agropyri]|uniref:AA1-like domain-containing protein n=1 Tax=Rhynchosporium agropyri TaxID=914238 RepID=A0A1E1KAC9_9HELO|nr:uncharacterized protein RAG0_04832 [Rhynchosporium agropyri]
MKLLVLSLLTSGAISAAVGGAGLEARAEPASCDCNLHFNGGQMINTRNIPTKPGTTQLNADYYNVDAEGFVHKFPNLCRVTWDRGQHPTVCSTWKQAAGPDGPNCPRSIFVKGKIDCYAS